MENQGGCVSERITRKLAVEAPSDELVDAYLAEIARGYKVDWSPSKPGGSEDDGEGGTKATEAVRAGSGDESGGGREPVAAEAETAEKAGNGGGGEEDAFTALSKRFEALKSKK